MPTPDKSQGDYPRLEMEMEDGAPPGDDVPVYDLDALRVALPDIQKIDFDEDDEDGLIFARVSMSSGKTMTFSIGKTLPATTEALIAVVRRSTASTRLVDIRDPAVRARLDALVGVYFQTSRAYCTVCRLPEGKTGTEALHDAELEPREDRDEWLRLLGERSCGDQYLRVFAPESDRLVLTPEEFAYYRSQGGGPYR